MAPQKYIQLGLNKLTAGSYAYVTIFFIIKKNIFLNQIFTEIGPRSIQSISCNVQWSFVRPLRRQPEPHGLDPSGQRACC